MIVLMVFPICNEAESSKCVLPAADGVFAEAKCCFNGSQKRSLAHALRECSGIGGAPSIEHGLVEKGEHSGATIGPLCLGTRRVRYS